MIRFFDKEIVAVMQSEVNRSDLMSYFLKGNREDIVVVFDELGNYVGLISYSSLLAHQDVKEAVDTHYVILDESVWDNGRKFFRQHKSVLGEVPLLPILNTQKELICFAYEDECANREIRMLWELERCEESLGFQDIYSAYDVVTIRECNELAWYLAKYLQKSGMTVNVEGDFWNELGNWKENPCIDYRNFVIYAEGTWQKNSNIKQELLRSVAPCFECIDRIYEANFFNGNIKNADGDIFRLLDKIRGRDIFIRGIERKSQDAYDVLLGYGIDICGFIAYDEYNRNSMLGKKIYSIEEVIKQFPKAAVIECEKKESAWEFGDVDMYAYMGVMRNEDYFCLQDYIDIPITMLTNVLKNKDIVMIGEESISRWVEDRLKDVKVSRMEYYDILREETKILLEESQNKIYLLMLPSDVGSDGSFGEHPLRIKYQKILKFHNGLDYTEYFTEPLVSIKMDQNRNKYRRELRPKKILLGAIPHKSGNCLLKGILDNHPNIMLMDFGFLNTYLYFFCIRLTWVPVKEILAEFWRMYSEWREDEYRKITYEQKQQFDMKMRELLGLGENFTAQEIFVMFHVAYNAMYKRFFDLEKTVIYWEPHNLDRNIVEYWAEWLQDESIQGYTVNIVRNQLVRGGSFIRAVKDYGILKEGNRWCSALFADEPEKPKFDNWKRIIMKFEELKMYPKDKLGELCEEMEIPWSETLLETTMHGETAWYRGGVTGFELRPVYNTYEEFFSSFDRMRIALISAPFQKKYGYPYVNCLDFSMEELQEMVIKPFRVEKEVHYMDKEDELTCKMNLVRGIRKELYQVRKEALISKKK